MKSVVGRFSFSVIINALFLILNSESLGLKRKEFFDNANGYVGTFIFLLLIVELFVSGNKAEYLSLKVDKEKFSVIERYVLKFIFLISGFFKVLLLIAATQMMFDSFDDIPLILNLFNLILLLVYLFFGVAEYGLIMEKAEKKDLKYKKLIERVHPIIMGLGVTFLWEYLVVSVEENKLDFEAYNFSSVLTFDIAMWILLFVPFYRYFLAEMFYESRSFLDNIISFFMILLLFVCAMIPLFF